MRKRMIGQDAGKAPEAEHHWLDIESLAQAEISSEDEAHPIESAFVAGRSEGWRAAESGKQTLRLLFDAPHRLGLIHLAFEEHGGERTQEFVLRWSADGGRTFHDIARQQYNFSAPDATREIEDYRVDLDGVTTLELSIIPDISGGSSRASLAEWRIA
jgi:hypothetical protein